MSQLAKLALGQASRGDKSFASGSDVFVSLPTVISCYRFAVLYKSTV